MNTQKQHRQHCSGLLLLLASKKIALLVFFFVCLFVCFFCLFILFFVCLIVIILKSDIFLLQVRYTMWIMWITNFFLTYPIHTRTIRYKNYKLYENYCPQSYNLHERTQIFSGKTYNRVLMLNLGRVTTKLSADTEN